MEKLIKYYRFGGWRYGYMVAKGHKWVTIKTIKAGGQYGTFKVDVNDKTSWKEISDD